MTFELKDNKGLLFRNREKKKESQPDYNGQLKVGDRLYNLAAWVNDSKSGNKYFSLSVSTPDGQKNDLNGEDMF